MDIYTLDPIPETAKPWHLTDAARLRLAFANDTMVKEPGVLRWKSNGRCVPPWSFKEAFCTPCQAHVDAYDAETQAFLAEYRESRKNYVPSGEELGEMRANFEPGAVVVDVITGQKFKL